MAYPPDYKFHFEDTNQKQKSNEIIYELWISSKKDKIDLVVSNEGKYIRLGKEKSAELFKLLIGRKLNDV